MKLAAVLFSCLVAGMVFSADKVEEEYRDLLEFDDENMTAVARLREELESKTGAELAKIRDRNEKQIRDKVFSVRNAYARFLERNPKHQKAMTAFASFLYEEGETDLPLKLWEQILVLDPKNAGAHNNLGNHYGISGNWKRALTEYEAAMKLAPSEPVYRLNWASVVDLNRKAAASARGWSEAETTRQIIAALKTARDLAPADFGYAKTYAQSLDSASPPQWMEALGAWKTCLKFAANVEEKDYANANAARVCIELGEKKQAREFITAITLKSSGPMKEDLQRRWEKLP